jgi:hypothetical protein
MQRLLEVAAQQRVIGQAAIARRLGVSDQVTTNWRARGVAEGGAINAQTVFGCSAQWILDGTGPMMLQEVSEVQREIANLSNDALHLALLFDDATRTMSLMDRSRLYHAASATIMVESRRLAPAPAPNSDAATPSAGPSRPRQTKISRA